MFKEKFFLYIELPPSRLRKRHRPSERIFTPEEKTERLRDLRETEEKEKQDAEQVAENLLNELEVVGIKCKKCGRRNVRENKKLSAKDERYSHLYCLDCHYIWKTPKD